MTVYHYGDFHSLQTADGNELSIDNGVHFPVYGGYGAPPISWQTRRGYKQHGQTEIDYTLSQRAITVDLVQVHAPDRQQYWDNRTRLHEFLRPNRGGPMTLVLTTPNGDQRAITVRPDPGLNFPGSRDNAWGIAETLPFIAFDPIWFDPTEIALTMTGGVGDHLEFPITFPIQFGAGGITLTTGDIAYAGSWESYPVITLTGPYTLATIQNVATGVSIDMVVAINVGEQRIITLTPGAQNVVDADGGDRFNELGPNSNLIDFNIRPDPEAADGTQEITVNFTGGSGASAVSMAYNTRYFAL